MHKCINKEASTKDQTFIINLLEDKLNHYNLHKKQLPSSKDNLKHRPLKSHEVEIECVYIVNLGGKQVGAYKLQYDTVGHFFRLFWMASTGEFKGIGSFIIKQAKAKSINEQCNLIKLSVNKSNTEAIKCYKNNGFEFVNTNNQECEMELRI